jgi:hypothetical protein
MTTLENRIEEIALKIAPDYPNIQNCDSWEKLYAIESSCLGTNAANDLHLLIIAMQSKLGWTTEELLRFGLDIQIGIQNNRALIAAKFAALEFSPEG